MAELVELRSVAKAMEARNGQLVAVSVDPVEKSAAVRQRYELPFPILCDTDHKLIRQLGIVHENGAPMKGDIAIPSHFLVRSDGTIVWRHIATRSQDRADIDEAIGAINALP